MTDGKTEVHEAEEEIWTFQRFKYEFFLCLTKVIEPNSDINEENTFLNDRKYYNQAKNSIYRIPISKPAELVPPFIINYSDLTPRLKSEFQDFCKLNEQREIGMFLKEIAVRFFENIDYQYTHDSVLPHLRVVMEDK